MARASTSLGLIKPAPVVQQIYTKNNAEGAGMTRPNEQDIYSTSQSILNTNSRSNSRLIFDAVKRSIIDTKRKTATANTN